MPNNRPHLSDQRQSQGIDPGSICFIVVAGGQGSRFGGELPKQFCLLAGRLVLMHSIEKIRSAFPASPIILAIREEDALKWKELCREHSFDSPEIVFGGAVRWETVKNAISKVPSQARIIAIHDGVRPLASPELIRRVISAVGESSGAVPAVPVTESICTILPGEHPGSADREKFRVIQTPQAFDAKRLIRAYALSFNEAFTDDSSVLSAAGYSDIVLVEGERSNIKITYPADLEIASIYLKHS